MINLAASFFYALGRFALGLILHPYQTMQLLVEQRLFVWVVLTPTALLGLLTLLWNFAIIPFSTHLNASCSELSAALPFLATWITTFVIYWQLMLLYLLVRFRRAQD